MTTPSVRDAHATLPGTRRGEMPARRERIRRSMWLASGVCIAGMLIAVFFSLARASAADEAGTPAQLSQQARSLEFEPLGHFGGGVTGIVAHDDLLFVSVGRYLEVRSARPGEPLAMLGRSTEFPPETVIGAVFADAAYLAERQRRRGDSGADVLHVVSVTDVAAPTEIGSLPLEEGALRSLAAVDGFLYAAGSRGLTLVDASSPDQPTLVGRLELGDLRAVWAGGDRLITASDAAILMFDIADRANPVALATVRGEGARALQVADGRLYALSRQALVAFDITDPGLAAEDRLEVWDAYALAVSGGVAWLARAPCCPRDSQHLDAIDVATTPMRLIDSQPALVVGLSSTTSTVWAAAGSAGLGEVEASSGKIVLQQPEYVLGAPVGLLPHGDYLVASDEDYELWTLGEIQPGTLSALGHLRFLERMWNGSRSGPLALLPTKAVVGAWWMGAWFTDKWLGVADISIASTPRFAGATMVYAEDQDGHRCSWQFDPPVVRGDRLYMSGGPNLMEIDVEPETPSLLRSYESDLAMCGSGGPALVGDTAWLATGEPWLEGVALDDPSGELKLRATIATGRFTSAVAAYGEYLVVGAGGLLIVDPRTGAIVAAADHVRPSRIQIQDNLALVFERESEGGGIATDWWFTVVDLEDLLRPRVLGRHLIESIEELDQAHAVLTDGWAYVTAGDSGIQVLRVTEGDVIPEPTEGPTLTPIRPTGTPAEPADTATPSATPAAPSVDTPNTGRTAGRVWLPSVMRGF